MPIPKVIIQTGPSPREEPSCNPWTDINPCYEYKYFDDAACAEFISKHFGPRALRAFWALRPGAFKADLFRYAYLFMHGGVYIDLDCVPEAHVSIDDIIGPGHDLVAALERRGIPGVWQGFLACTPGLPVLLEAVNRICSNVETSWYPSPGGDVWTGVLSITGPVLLASAMGARLEPGQQTAGGVRVFLHRVGEDPDCSILSEDGTILLRGTSHSHRTTKERYDALVLARKAYW